jgi:hypothetical protein
VTVSSGKDAFAAMNAPFTGMNTSASLGSPPDRMWESAPGAMPVADQRLESLKTTVKTPAGAMDAAEREMFTAEPARGGTGRSKGQGVCDVEVATRVTIRALVPVAIPPAAPRQGQSGRPGGRGGSPRP